MSEYPGSYLTKDDNWLVRHPDCINVPDWRGAICSGRYAQVGGDAGCASSGSLSSTRGTSIEPGQREPLAELGLCCCTAFSLVAASRGCPSLRCQASHCGGFSRCGARALERRLQWLWRKGLVLVGYSRTRDYTCVPCIVRQSFTIEPPGKPTGFFFILFLKILL